MVSKISRHWCPRRRRARTEDCGNWRGRWKGGNNYSREMSIRNIKTVSCDLTYRYLFNVGSLWYCDSKTKYALLGFHSGWQTPQEIQNGNRIDVFGVTWSQASSIPFPYWTITSCIFFIRTTLSCAPTILFSFENNLTQFNAGWLTSLLPVGLYWWTDVSNRSPVIRCKCWYLRPI